MAKLYRFICEPNYPVCNGEIIFFVEDGQAKELARKCGFTKYKGKSSVLYLGEFFPRIEFKNNVVTFQNGEY